MIIMIDEEVEIAKLCKTKGKRSRELTEEERAKLVEKFDCIIAYFKGEMKKNNNNNFME